MPLLTQYQRLFDTLERQPLTLNQRQACVSQAQNTLVLAGAGTGKTSTLMGRVAYLLQSQQAQAQEILLLAFAVEAAKEMQERGQALCVQSYNAESSSTESSRTDSQAQGGRQDFSVKSSSTKFSITGTLTKAGEQSFSARTFHSLGLHIIQSLRQTPVKLSQLHGEGALALFMQERFAQRLLSDDNIYKQAVRDYFTYYAEEIQQGTYRSLADEYLANPLELMLANTLYQEQITYHYQAHFEHDIYFKPYQAYRATFFLSSNALYINVFDCEEAQLHELINPVLKDYANRRKKVRKIHQKYNVDAIEVYRDKILNGRTGENLLNGLNTLRSTECEAHHSLKTLQDLFIHFLAQRSVVKEAKPIFRSPGRADALLRLLTDIVFTMHAEHLDWQELKSMVPLEQAHLLELAYPLYQDYLQQLKREGAIDFEQMIQLATEAVRSGAYQVSWQDVLIDEFQDISASRFALIQAIREQKPSIRLFCVGDDWQSIYQFAGSQVRYTRDFEQYFGPTQRYTLDLTFRFHQALCDSSTQFIQANPAQTRKSLRSFRSQDELGLSLISDHEHLEKVFEHILLMAEAQCEAEEAATPPKQIITCLILARFSHLLPSPRELQRWQQAYPNLSLKLSTIHAAKGKEADYVIVLGNQAGQFGLPSDKQSHPLIHAMRQDDEEYPHAQERRVFYVAISRARQHVYLMCSETYPSAFIEEIRAGAYVYHTGLVPINKRPNRRASREQGACLRTSTIRKYCHGLWQKSIKRMSEWLRDN